MLRWELGTYLLVTQEFRIQHQDDIYTYAGVSMQAGITKRAICPQYAVPTYFGRYVGDSMARDSIQYLVYHEETPTFLLPFPQKSRGG